MNKLVPCAWLLSDALEVWWFRLRLVRMVITGLALFSMYTGTHGLPIEKCHRWLKASKWSFVIGDYIWCQSWWMFPERHPCKCNVIMTISIVSNPNYSVCASNLPRNKYVGQVYLAYGMWNHFLQLSVCDTWKALRIWTRSIYLSMEFI